MWVICGTVGWNATHLPFRVVRQTATTLFMAEISDTKSVWYADNTKSVKYSVINYPQENIAWEWLTQQWFQNEMSYAILHEIGYSNHYDDFLRYE